MEAWSIRGPSAGTRHKHTNTSSTWTQWHIHTSNQSHTHTLKSSFTHTQWYRKQTTYITHATYFGDQESSVPRWLWAHLPTLVLPRLPLDYLNTSNTTTQLISIGNENILHSWVWNEKKTNTCSHIVTHESKTKYYLTVWFAPHECLIV